ncbi:sensor histidine kinase [Konateibacter massiliensis]|uniref:sensor histidine kinase n=1 Tax=Konateibacter massiliensis TaxID=2002841 RepID=UPI000C160C27|nr:ATP-binding protein [Konateibacter massiliensis]
MLNNNDREQLEKLTETNPELKNIVSRLAESYNFNIGKFSHELRNPLTLISSSLQLIEAQHPEVKDFRFWNETMADIQYVLSLLDELSKFNQSDILNLSQFEIGELVDSVCFAVRNDICDSSCTLTCTYSKSLPKITGDAIKIRQVITNLIKNAKDAVNPENGSIQVTILDVNPDKFQISIADNGSGIPAEFQNTIFEPFVTHKANGSGLGLPICKNIVEAHGGSITFETQENIGTTFYITLPISPN